MKLGTRLATLALSAGLLIAPSAARAEQFDLRFDDPVKRTGSSTTFSVTSNDITLNVKVTAIQYYKGKFRHATSLPIYDYGNYDVLGAISPNDEDCSYNYHQVDNINGVDFLVFQFDREVTLNSISRYGLTAGPSNTTTWSNVSIGSGNFEDPVKLADLTALLSDLTTVEGLRAISHGTTFDTDSLNFTDAANLWIVGADSNTATRSAFKLASLGVTWQSSPLPQPPAVPEPATWAMLILGFSLVGGALRRRPGFRSVSA